MTVVYQKLMIMMMTMKTVMMTTTHNYEYYYYHALTGSQVCHVIFSVLSIASLRYNTQHFPKVTGCNNKTIILLIFSVFIVRQIQKVIFLPRSLND